MIRVRLRRVWARPTRWSRRLRILRAYFNITSCIRFGVMRSPGALSPEPGSHIQIKRAPEPRALAVPRKSSVRPTMVCPLA